MIEEPSRGADSGSEFFCDEALDSQDYFSGSDNDMAFFVSTEEDRTSQEEEDTAQIQKVASSNSIKKKSRMYTIHLFF